MSNTLAIAAVTAKLCELLLSQVPSIAQGLTDLEVTTQPLDLVHPNGTNPHLNLFLYQVAVNRASRVPVRPPIGSSGHLEAPPLALDLHYLLTAYDGIDVGKGTESHRALGAAMRVLHGQPLLEMDERSGGPIPPLQISWQPIGLDDMSKLWAMAQAPYRLSTVYQVSIVLIDSL